MQFRKISTTFKAFFIATVFVTAAPMALTQTAPLTLIHQTELPEIVGEFEHLAVELKRDHLIVTAEKHHSVEMFDLKSGEHLKSIPGFKTPHAMAFVPEKDELLIADGGDSALILVSAADFRRIDRVPLIPATVPDGVDSPDAAFYDSQNRLYYIGNGGESAGRPDSVISIYSVDQNKLIGSIPIPGNNVESIGIDNPHHRLYVNIRDKQEVGVVDLATRRIVDTWKVPGLKGNTALLVDHTDQRVFVAGRKPGILYVFDMQGKVTTQLPCVDVNDDMMWDSTLKRLYVSGSQGLSIFHQDSVDSYREITRIPTNGGKTSYLIPQLKKFYVVHPKTDVDIAGLLVYQVNP